MAMTTTPSLLRCYVDGQFIDSGTYFDNINPVNGATISQIAEANDEIINLAVKSARQAQTSEWGNMTVNQRCSLLYKVADRMAERENEFIEAEIADTGKSLFQVKNIDIPRGKQNFSTFADLAKQDGGETFFTELASGEKALNYSVKKPLGVVAVISTWNLPLLLATWKVAPAMECGNYVILKTSEETSSSAT